VEGHHAQRGKMTSKRETIKSFGREKEHKPSKKSHKTKTSKSGILKL
jgi:hypothetical protein